MGLTFEACTIVDIIQNYQTWPILKMAVKIDDYPLWANKGFKKSSDFAR